MHEFWVQALTTGDVRLAADIGGTFTDIALRAGQRLWTTKVLTTGEAPEVGLRQGVDRVLADAGLSLADVDVFVHGTTLATNAIIERRGVPTALLTTDGFRDVLEIATESRFDQYDIALVRPVPLVERPLRLPIRERMDARGGVRLALNEEDVLQAAATLRHSGVRSVAIAFLHAFMNDAHEVRAAELLRSVLPDVSISISSAVCPEIREYERVSTTVANAYVQPLLEGYLARMEQSFRADGFRGFLAIMSSGGGLVSIDIARNFPVRLIESGPAGGAIFASRISATLAATDVLAFDMGGTTAKVTMLVDGQPRKARVFEADRTERFLKGSGLPLRIPVVEMVEIGAGGGSIARLDTLGQLRVGPESAGSQPGPASYGRGGARPTVTDADLLLGLIDPDDFAGGAIRLDADRARTAVTADLAQAMQLSPEGGAHALYEMVCENMASAARSHAAERGVVVSRQTMIAFGGAAPLHAARLAEKLEIARVVVPSSAGVGSAVGFLDAPISFELTRSRYTRLDAFDFSGVNAMLAAMSAEAAGWVRTGAGEAPVATRTLAFMRYVGQGYEIEVEVPSRALVDADLVDLRRGFEQVYEALFKRAIPNGAIEITTWSVMVSTIDAPPQAEAASPPPLPAIPKDLIRIFDGAAGRDVEVPRYRRESLAPGAHFEGPGLIVEDETATLVTGSFRAHIHPSGAIVLERKEAR